MGIPWLRFLTARRSEGAGTLCGLFVRSLFTEGPGPTWRRLRSYVRTVGDAARAPLPPLDTRKDVLFVSGCPGHPRRWRCEHAQERLLAAGGSADIVDHPAADLRRYVDCYRRFVLQRVPHEPMVAEFVAMARARGKRVTADVDDLVFHEAHGEQLPFLRGSPRLARELYVQQLRRIGQVMALVDACTVSTPALAAEVRAHHPALPVTVVRNRPSAAMLAAAAPALATAPDVPAAGQPFVLGYYAGTRTHAADFAPVAPVLAEVLAARPQARLLLVGEIEPPAVLAPLAARIERSPLVPWQRLPVLQRRAHVHLVPLEDSLFAACKSELKWLEAGLVGRPVLASAVGPYRDCVRDAVDGWLAATADDWRARLLAAIDSPARAAQCGAAARAAVLALAAAGPDDLPERQ